MKLYVQTHFTCGAPAAAISGRKIRRPRARAEIDMRGKRKKKGRKRGRERIKETGEYRVPSMYALTRPHSPPSAQERPMILLSVPLNAHRMLLLRGVITSSLVHSAFIEKAMVSFALALRFGGREGHGGRTRRRTADRSGFRCRECGNEGDRKSA